jgi:hypothetical protein
MAMAVATLGPKELKLREQRQAGGNEVARRYGVPVKKISLAQAREQFPDGKAALRKATTPIALAGAIKTVGRMVDRVVEAEDLQVRAAARAEAAQIRIAELETEVVTLKRELAKRGSTCPVCTARKEANRLSMRKKRQGVR